MNCVDKTAENSIYKGVAVVDSVAAVNSVAAVDGVTTVDVWMVIVDGMAAITDTVADVTGFIDVSV